MPAVTLATEQLSEALFMGQVTDLASMRGWRWMHIQPGLTDRGRYRTPVSGPLGPGWPDLILIRGSQILAVELKSEKGRTTALQERVLNDLREALIPVYVWRPSQWEQIERVLA